MTSFTVLIPDGESAFALFAMHCLAREPGVRVDVRSRQRLAATRFSRFRRHYSVEPSDADDDERLGILADHVRKQRIDVVLPTGSDWISFAAREKTRLGSIVKVAPVPEPAALGVADDKWLLSRFMVEHDIPGPPTELVSADRSFLDRLDLLEFPVLLKPVTAWGGEGIVRFDRSDALLAHLDSSPDLRMGSHVVQTLRPGFVVGVNVLARRGAILASTVQRGFIPNANRYAAAGGVEFTPGSPYLSAVERLMRALAWTGFANLDTLVLPDGTHEILEINARFWGSLRGSLAAGVNFPYLACLTALDIPFARPEFRAARYLHPKTALRVAMQRVSGSPATFSGGPVESGLRFLVVDPIAEAIRALRQEYIDQR